MTHNGSRRWALVVAVALCAGCGGQPDEAEYPVPFWQEDAGVAADADAGVREEVEYFASWTQRRHEVQDPSPFSNAWEESRTTALSLVRVVWTGDSGMRWEQPCALHSNETHGTPVTFPSAFLRAIPIEPIAVTRQAGKIVQPSFTSWLGLKNGYTGAMPRLGEGGHAAIIDADGDGKPGVTIHVDITLYGDESIYVVSRTTSSWTAVAGTDGRYRATPQVQREQRTVGASRSILVADEVTRAVTGRPPEEIVWGPAKADLDCSRLVANAGTLVGHSWPP